MKSHCMIAALSLEERIRIVFSSIMGYDIIYSNLGEICNAALSVADTILNCLQPLTSAMKPTAQSAEKKPNGDGWGKVRSGR